MNNFTTLSLSYCSAYMFFCSSLSRVSLHCPFLFAQHICSFVLLSHAYLSTVPFLLLSIYVLLFFSLTRISPLSLSYCSAYMFFCSSSLTRISPLSLSYCSAYMFFCSSLSRVSLHCPFLIVQHICFFVLLSHAYLSHCPFLIVQHICSFVLLSHAYLSTVPFLLFSIYVPLFFSLTRISPLSLRFFSYLHRGKRMQRFPHPAPN